MHGENFEKLFLLMGIEGLEVLDKIHHLVGVAACLLSISFVLGGG